MVLDARIGERETLVKDGTHCLFGFDQSLLRWDVGGLSPSLICELLILHHPRCEDRPSDEYRTGDVHPLLHPSPSFNALDVDQGRDE